MISQNKPFDLAIIESPYEYHLASERELLGLKELSTFCRKYQIPVRVHELSASKEHLIFQENVDDTRYLITFWDVIIGMV
jgi:hypothetical protein